MTNQRTDEVTEGAPLVVCINDCALDQGQPSEELAPLCFKLGCAFAEMRWKSSVDKGEDLAIIVPQETFRTCSNRL